MNGIAIVPEHTVQLLQSLGIEHPLLAINIETVYYTFVAMACILLLAFAGRKALDYPYSVGEYCALYFVSSFIGLVEQTCEKYNQQYTEFCISLFTFIFFCNSVVVFPGIEEATKDLNTTFGLAIFSFLYAQSETMRHKGFIAWLSGYIKLPSFYEGFSLRSALLNILILIFTIARNIIELPLALLGKASGILSLSLRLFGNIFGGAIIAHMLKAFLRDSVLYHLLFFPVTAVVLIFFGLFEAFIQALVFAVLTISNIATATSDSGGGH